MSKLRVLDLFSGIGGFSLGLERTGGFETVAFCEIEPFPRKVLAKHWPKVPCYEDVTKLTGQQLAADGIAVDVITGGFPCQDISCAGKQAGIGEGTRSGLWSECLRLVSELRPQYAIFENVANLLRGPSEQPGGWFSTILRDLASIGYDAEWENIPAAAVGAPHRRERVWIMAYPDQRFQSRLGSIQTAGCGCSDTRTANKTIPKKHKHLCKVGKDVADTTGQRQSGPRQSIQSECSAAPKNWQTSVLGPVGFIGKWKPEPELGRVANGIPNRVDRLKTLGNSVVPQIPELIGNAILEAEATA